MTALLQAANHYNQQAAAHMQTATALQATAAMGQNSHPKPPQPVLPPTLPIAPAQTPPPTNPGQS